MILININLNIHVEHFLLFLYTDKPRYIDTNRDMSFVSLYRICQYIETKFHSIFIYTATGKEI